MPALVAAATVLLVLVAVILKVSSKRKAVEGKLAELEVRFAPVIDADATAKQIISEAESSAASIKREAATVASSIADLRRQYAEKKVIYDRLASEVALFDERLAFAEMGVYEPHFDFTDSEQFKDAIERVRAEQKAMVSAKTAAICATNWTVDGSKSKGQTMTGRNIRLTLRAFNNECDAAIANVRWNNANAMVKRIGYARAAREEQKLIREMEEAEREEAKYQKLLEKAKTDAIGAHGAKLEAYSHQIEILQRDLAEAHAKVERAQAMAEMTRSGYVYIISNMGAFGPDMVKIGLTRRLDPTDRVRELGDASVPFFFDTHAIIYSDEAPALERALHTEFAKQRVNATNMRKEFFRVSLDQVEEAVTRLAPGASFFRDIEAQEYRETMALRNAQLEAQIQQKEAVFPDAI
ncbi:MAG: DUF4041 domain-containing protein [Paracoccus denitrificans]|nr:MAG: DUF4041 domain-containing protein [Paracoccus denitrificans]PZO82875.1 MAG: DUF4041 domain-containing protein [Paracoccus denitrificans]